MVTPMQRDPRRSAEFALPAFYSFYMKSESNRVKLLAIHKMLLELRKVGKYYEAPNGADAPYVLKDVTLRVAAGESVAITGPSGSGKSTLLNIIGALDRPSTGHVLMEGRDLSQLDDKELAMIRNREIGFIFQLHHLLPQYTVLENVLVPTLAQKSPQPPSQRGSKRVAPTSQRGEAAVDSSQRRGGHRAVREETEARARRLLERVGLASRLSYRPGRLSGGERQRAAVVRALINRPKLLLADEPTGSLDRAAADNLAQLLVELNREEGVTLILVTHSSDLAALMSRVLELKDGVLIPKRRSNE